MNTDTARFNMIEQQIRPWHVLDASVLELLSIVKREDFVPAAHQNLAFADMEVPLIGSDEEAMRLGQCMLEPRLEARMLQDLAIQPHESVLEIGAGSGYMAALLSKKASHVVTLEITPELATMARNNLRMAGIQNVEVHLTDGALHAPAAGMFDVIILSGSVIQVPEKLLHSLKIGGRLGAIVGDAPPMVATVVTRNSETDFSSSHGWETSAPRLRNFPEPSRFSF